MRFEPPRGIAVVDAGYTNTKIALFSAAGQLVTERKIASRHVEGPPYRHIDPEPMVALCREVLPELDLILPVDAIVPCAHGAALACLDAEGQLALPVMDYTAEPPAAIVAGYRKIMPPFSETFCALLPMALTHGLQLYWQQRAFPVMFSTVTAVIPWIQYVGFVLSGVAVSEISSLSCQTHLLDTRTQQVSSLVKAQGWTHLFPAMAKAWASIGTLRPEFRGPSFRGRAQVLAGVHDSNANYLRYLCGGLGAFTLVSTGTWSISFDTSTTVGKLFEDRDTNTNTDVLGRIVACSRFFGGREFEIVARGAPAQATSLEKVADLVWRGTLALPGFTDSGGPVPKSGSLGRIAGAAPVSEAERSSLAALYCALMVSEQLDAVSSRHDIIVDGPFATNPVLLAVLAQLRPAQRVLASELRDGTTAGAACLALTDDGKLPRIALKLVPVAAAAIPGLGSYYATWKKKAYAHLG